MVCTLVNGSRVTFFKGSYIFTWFTYDFVSRFIHLLVVRQYKVPSFLHPMVHKKTEKWFTYPWLVQQLSMHVFTPPLEVYLKNVTLYTPVGIWIVKDLNNDDKYGSFLKRIFKIIIIIIQCTLYIRQTYT